MRTENGRTTQTISDVNVTTGYTSGKNVEMIYIYENKVKITVEEYNSILVCTTTTLCGTKNLKIFNSILMVKYSL